MVKIRLNKVFLTKTLLKIILAILCKQLTEPSKSDILNKEKNEVAIKYYKRNEREKK